MSPAEAKKTQPRELSGFYWDEGRERYFPLSSKPKPASSDYVQRTTRPLPQHENVPLYRRRPFKTVAHAALERLKTGQSYSARSRITHELFNRRIATSLCSSCESEKSYASLWNHASTITSFCVSDINGWRHMIAGDLYGWLYSRCEEYGEPNSLFTAGEQWCPELALSSKITHISIDGTRCVATSFGPTCKIIVKDLSASEMFMLTPGDHLVHDVWSASFKSKSLVLGMRNKAVHLKDIDSTRQFQSLETKSDVLSVHQLQDLVLTGSRNGSIQRFDLRVGGCGQTLLQARISGKTTSVTYLNVIREWELLMSTMSGNLEMFDLRFFRNGTQLMIFAEHNNSYTPELGVAVAPSEDFVFAAGQDGRIRGWSLHTAEPLCSLQIPPTDAAQPMAFAQPSRALQITEESGGMRLWATSGKYIHTFNLGWAS